MRGEHQVAKIRGSEIKGSSPHARGARGDMRGHCRDDGIIPACAGSTMSLKTLLERLRDHPRMRGEHLDRSATPCRAQGSSPHARGAQRLTSHAAQARRIIPACAGSTRMCRETLALRRDHPRMRGEHEMVQGKLIDQAGGIIPACAGSTSRRACLP